jgi:hypothetical protein
MNLSASMPARIQRIPLSGASFFTLPSSDEVAAFRCNAGRYNSKKCNAGRYNAGRYNSG